jgi:hemolysin III
MNTASSAPQGGLGARARAKRSSVPLPFQTPGEEIANSVIHGVGALLSVAALVLLVLKARDAWEVASYAVYGSTLILLFSASTLYHAIVPERAKRVFQVFDHGAIYLLIAGTYTPFCLGPLRGPWGWTIFGVEWVLAATGIALYAAGVKALKKIEVAVYILMGWAVVAGWFPLVQALPRSSLYLMVAGGIFYTMGTYWYRQKIKRGAHVVWHAFVFAGALAHFWAVWALS